MDKQIISKVNNSIVVNLKIFIGKQGDYFVSYCPALELSSYGDTIQDAKKGFDEALKIFINETEKRGTLEKILLKLGWSLKQEPQPSYIPPKVTKHTLQKFNSSSREFTERVALPY